MPCSDAELEWLRATLPGFSDAMLSAMWDQAVEDVCTDSWCWQVGVTYDLPENETIVVLVPPVTATRTVWVARVSLVAPKGLVAVRCVEPGRLEALRAADARTHPVWARIGVDVIELWPPSSEPRQVAAQIALAPAGASLPPELAAVVRPAVEARVRFFAHMHPTWPHADRAVAAFHDRVYRTKVLDARVWGETRYGPRSVTRASPEGVPL